MVREAVIQVENGPVLADVGARPRCARDDPAGRRRVQAAGGRQAAPADSLQEKLAGRAEAADRSQHRRSVLHGAAGVGEGDSGPDIWRPCDGGLGVRRRDVLLDRASEVVWHASKPPFVCWLSVRCSINRTRHSRCRPSCRAAGRCRCCFSETRVRSGLGATGSPIRSSSPRGSTLEMIATPHAAEPGRNSHTEAQQLPGRARLRRDVSRNVRRCKST